MVGPDFVMIFLLAAMVGPDFVMIFLLAALVVVVPVVLHYTSPRLWMKAWASGARVSLTQLVALRFRGVPPVLIVNTCIKARKAGLNVSAADLEAHLLAGGNVTSVVEAVIVAKRAALDLSFERASAIDLSGNDVSEAVARAVSPEIMPLPEVSAVARDGKRVRVSGNITVRANLDRWVGGAREETLLGRISQGVMAAIASAPDHRAVLEAPETIAVAVLEKGVDIGTAFEIISIDLTEIQVDGDNQARTGNPWG